MKAFVLLLSAFVTAAAIARTSELYSLDPLPLAGVVNLDGPGD